MQKLVFTNSKGVSVDLTSGDFGITNWKGFDNTGLNLQTQTVPFTDGSVYIDGLLNNRDLTVTLALQDDGNLEKRYELKRRLIEILNPKLGEGVLVYTNNYLSRRIKVVPSIPLFANKNSNDRGTQKGNLVFTACNPYWEDTEETVVDLKRGVRQIVENKGDVPCSITADLYTSNIEKPRLINFTENKKIELKGTYDTSINIDTTSGNKNVTTENINFELDEYNFFGLKIAYNFNSGIYCGISKRQIWISSNGINWKYIKEGNFADIIFAENNFFVIDNTENVSTKNIIKSENGENWEIVATLDTGGGSLDFINFINGKFYTGGAKLSLFTSTDGVTWEGDYSTQTTTHTAAIKNVGNILLQLQVLSLSTYHTSTVLISSDNGETWEIISGLSRDYTRLVVSKEKFYLVEYSSRYYYAESTDGETWVENNSEDLPTYIENLFYFYNEYNKTFYKYDNWEGYTSTDGENWDLIKEMILPMNYLFYSERKNLFLCVKGDYICKSDDCKNWIKVYKYTSPSITSAKKFVEMNDKILLLSYKGWFESEDYENWEYKQIISDSYDFVNIVKGNDFYIATARNNPNSYKIYKSTDGEIWTEIENINLICYVYKDKFIGYNNSNFYTSTDGENWTEYPCGENLSSINNIIYVSELDLFVACGSKNSYNNSMILTSKDGENWITRYSSYSTNEVFDVCFNKQLFKLCASTRKNILTSVDGKNWNEERSFNITLYYVVAKREKFYISIYEGGLVTSFFTDFENLIADLTEDSNMNLSLEVGDNELLISGIGDQFNVTLKYRQRYVGV